MSSCPRPRFLGAFASVRALGLLIAAVLPWPAAAQTIVSVTTGTSGGIAVNEIWSLDDPAGNLDAETTIDGGLWINRTTDGTLGGAVVGAGDLRKKQSSTWSISGNPGYTGNIYLDAGTLELSDDSAGMLTEGAIVFNGGWFSYGTTPQYDYSSQFSGSQYKIAVVGGSNSVAFESPFGTSLVKAGSGTLAFDGNPSFSGGVTVNEGILLLSDDAIGLDGGVTLGTNTSLDLYNDVADYTQTYSGNIGGTGRVTIDGEGIVALGGNNSYSGGTDVNSPSSLLGTTSSIQGAVLNDGRVTFDQAGAGTYAGNMSGSGVLELASGAVTLSGSNSYGGGTRLAGGTLLLGSARAIGTAGTITFDGGTLAFTAANNSDYSSRFDTAPSQAYDIDVAESVEVTFASPLTSVGGTLVKSGSGTLVLGAANTFDGGTTVYGGTLAGTTTGVMGPIFISNGIVRITEDGEGSFSGTIDGVFGDSLFEKQGSGTLEIADGGWLGVETAVRSGTLRGDSQTLLGDIAVDGPATVEFDEPAGSGEYAGAVSGEGQLVKKGEGTLILSGASSHTGGSTVDAGTLQLGPANLSGQIDVNDATLRFTESVSGTYTGDINIFQVSGSAVLEKTGAGTLTIDGDLYSDGTVDVQAGTLRLSSGTIMGALTSSGTLEKVGGGQLDVTGVTNQIGGTIIVSAGELTGTLDNLDVSITNNATVRLSGAYGDYGGTMTGGGFLIISDSDVTITGTGNTYSGGTAVDGDAILRGNASTIRGDLAIYGEVEFTQTASGTFAGDISGSGVLTKSGAGSLTLAGTSSFGSGFATVTGGDLVGTTSSLALGSLSLSAGTSVVFDQATSGTAMVSIDGDGAVVVRGGGTVSLFATNTHTGGTSVEAGTLVGNTESLVGAITNLSHVRFEQSAEGTYAGSMSGTGDLVKSGTAALTLSGSNTYSGGTTLAAGTLVLGSAGALGMTGTISFTGGTLRASAANTSDYSARFSNAPGQAYSLDTAGESITLAGDLASVGGTLVKWGTGTLTLTGSNTYSGGTTVDAGGLLVTTAAALPGTGPLVVASGASITFSNVSRSFGDLDANGLIDLGTGVLTVTGTLSGSGTIASDTEVGGVHSPGNSPGIQTFQGDLEYRFLGSAPGVLWELVTSSTASPGTNYDQIAVAGDLGFSSTTNLELSFDGSGSTVDWSDAFWDESRSWTIYDVGGTTGGFADLVLTPANWLDGSGQAFDTFRPDGDFALSLVGSDVVLTYSIVPEPSTWVLAATAVAAALARLRRRGGGRG